MGSCGPEFTGVMIDGWRGQASREGVPPRDGLGKSWASRLTGFAAEGLFELNVIFPQISQLFAENDVLLLCHDMMASGLCVGLVV